MGKNTKTKEQQCAIHNVSGSVRIQIPLEYAETLHGLIDSVIGGCDNDELVRQLTTILKKLDKGIEELTIPQVSISFFDEKVKEAYSDGFGDNIYDFDIENYR